MKGLLIFIFQTGEEPTRFFEVMVWAESPDCLQIEDALASYIETPDAEDLSYEEIVFDVMNSTGVEWREYTYGEPITISSVDTFFV